ncbi:exodeoxyribonuclease III [archaeon]|nr:exodeoxyribonuclease III [archaeon]
MNSCARKGLLDFMKDEDAGVYCFQELKSSEETIRDDLKELNDYHIFFNFAEKRGYSGTACYSKKKPLSVTKGIGVEKFDREGRVLTLEFKDFYLINAYFPHSSRDLSRLDFKLEFNKAFKKYVGKFRKDIIIASDFNVAHKPRDLANPTSNKKNAGFRPEERKWFTNFLKNGYVDTFRMFNEEGGNYTYWSFMHNARGRNIGWRIDYFVVNEDFKDKVQKSEILSDVKGSDHCPIRIKLKK